MTFEEAAAEIHRLNVENSTLRARAQHLADDIFKARLRAEGEKEFRMEDKQELDAKVLLFARELNRVQALFETLFGKPQ